MLDVLDQAVNHVDFFCDHSFQLVDGVFSLYMYMVFPLNISMS